MQTTAGSLALQGTPALHDSTVAASLRAGGAVILGKTNLSEWANFRSFNATSGGPPDPAKMIEIFLRHGMSIAALPPLR